MFQVQWVQQSPTYFTADPDKHQLKFTKRIWPGNRIVYSIFQKDQLKFNTTIEHVFIRAAYGAITNQYGWYKQ